MTTPDDELNDILRALPRELAAMPPLQPAERAPFEALRGEFQGAFRDARATHPAVQLVIDLRTLLFRLGQAAAGTLTLPLSPAHARGAGASSPAIAQWHIEPNVTAHLWLNGGGLGIDLVRDDSPMRPFAARLLDPAHATPPPWHQCVDDVATLLLPLPGPGRLTLELRATEVTASLTIDVEPTA